MLTCDDYHEITDSRMMQCKWMKCSYYGLCIVPLTAWPLSLLDVLMDQNILEQHNIRIQAFDI